MEKRRTPSGLFHYYSGANLKSEMDMWKVQTESSADGKGYWVGQIMTGQGFNDSPDCEFVSGGKSGKDITGMAMGRAGNLFHWGFSASPAFMTESAKQVFVNTVFYMSQFNGRKSTVKRFVGNSRKWVDEMCYRETHRLIDHKQNKCAETGDDEKDQLIKYYTENYNYFYFKGRSSRPILDKEVKSLGIANNDIKLLDKCVEMLESGKDTEKALLILKRYTQKNYNSVGQWRKWLKKYRKYLFFTEVGGFKFMVDTWNYPQLAKDLIVSNTISNSGNDGDISSEEVVKVSGELVNIGGDDYTLNLVVDIKKGWHLYAKLTKEASYFVKTEIKFNVAKGVKLKGKLVTPKTFPYKGAKGVTLYEGKSVFKQKLKIDKSKIKSKSIECVIKYQACDDYMCQSPTEKKIMVKLK